MGFANKYNKVVNIFALNTNNFAYRGLDELELGKTYIVRGMHINPKTTFGDAPVIWLDDCFVNLPNHMTSTIRDMLNDPDVVDVCDNGRLGMEVYTYVADKYNKTCFGVHFVDVE